MIENQERDRTMSPETFDRSNRLGFKAWLILMLYGSTLLGLWLGSTRVLTWHEAFSSEQAREMLITGNWIVPHYGTIATTHKPPMFNWLIALSMSVFDSHDEWVCRLPSLLAALLTAWMVAALGARWHGRRVGLASGLIVLSSFYVLMQARLAEIDMLLCFAVTGAIVCFILAEDERKPPGKGMRLVLTICFFAFIALALLAKYLIGPCFIAGGILLYVLLRRRRRALLFCLHPAGWLVFLALALPSYIAAYKASPEILDRWILEHFGRFTRSGGAWGRQHPLLFYFYMTPLIMMPWTTWLAGGILLGARKKMWLSRNWQLIACFFFAALILLTASSWKHKHYILPVLPCLAIPSAWYLVNNTYEHIDKRRPPALVSLLLIVAAAVGIFIVWQARPDIMALMTIGILGCVGLLITATFLDYHRRPRSTLVALFATFWLVGVFVQAFVIQHFDSYRHQAELGKRVNTQVTETETLYTVNIYIDQILFYLRRPVRRIDTIEAFSNEVRQNPADDYYIVTAAGDVEKFRSLGNVQLLDQVEKPRPRQTEKEKLVFIRLQTGLATAIILGSDVNIGGK
ncbi:MAG: hypothetical protein DRP66_00595 [Planctomycetota bacterium]|nr:MAG: hypothetical protein DRP66_00595 [Planctomycetota bacterium]